MVEINVTTPTLDIAKLKDEKRSLSKEIDRACANQDAELLANLLLEYADKCTALGHEYQQKGDEERAKDYEKVASFEFDAAKRDRQEASRICHNIR